MQERAFERTRPDRERAQGRHIGEWAAGIGGWTGADDRQSLAVLQAAVDAGVAFLDLALVYGAGHSDELLGQPHARSCASSSRRGWVAAK